MLAMQKEYAKKIANKPGASIVVNQIMFEFDNGSNKITDRQKIPSKECKGSR